jgi:hypothetical protein
MPVARADVMAPGIELTIIPLVGSTRAAPAAGTARDVTRTRSPAPAAQHTSDPRWWVVRARYGDGWRVHIVNASERIVRLARDPVGSGPEFVTVTAVDRAGQESPPVRVSPM